MLNSVGMFAAMVPKEAQFKANEKKSNNFPAALILGLICFNIGVTQIFDLSIAGSIHLSKLDDVKYIFSPTDTTLTAQEISSLNFGVSLASGLWIILALMSGRKFSRILLNSWLLTSPFLGGISAITYGWFMNLMQKELAISNLQLVIGWIIAMVFLYGRVILYLMVCVLSANMREENEKWEKAEEILEKAEKVRAEMLKSPQYTRIDYSKVPF